MKINALLFDMDGVLIDSYEAWFKRFNAALKEFGFKTIDRKEFSKYVWAINFSETVGKYFPGKTIDEIRGYYTKTFDFLVDNLKTTPNVEGALKGLKKKKLTLAVASNTQSNLVKLILGKFGILKCFDKVVGGENVKKGKPDPEILFLALRKLRMRPQDVVFIGDTIYDKQAAAKAGIRFIGYKIDGDNRIDDFKNLLSVIEDESISS